jgi:glycosyltransferase involved in cell wall biosynthesis
MRVGQVHQLIPDFKPADAMGQAAVAWQRVLRHLGYTGEIFAGSVAPEFRSLVRPAHELKPAPDDLVLYHHGIASPLAGRVMHLPCRRAVVFHNVTPVRFYEGTRLAEALFAGRAQLAALADAVDFSIGVSEFNAAELREAGHRNVHVVPLFVEAERFVGESNAPKLPRMVSVSRVVPHKRMEDLLSLHEELRRIALRAELWIVGGYAPGNEAFKRLYKRAMKIGGVRFLGRVSHEQLVAAYRQSDVFVSMSEHEGFGVPLIEAMACEIPVLAFGAAAVPETMGGRGVVFDEKNFAALAEVVREVTDNAALRKKLIAGQLERVSELSFENTLKQMAAALTPTLSRISPIVVAPRGFERERGISKRVAFVVQRFGEEISGGAEAHARQVAVRLAKHVKVEVLTTCAKDHLTWANEFAPGVERDGALTVHRFPVARPRQMRPFNRLSDSVFKERQDFVTETHWLAEQGPLSPALLRAITERRDEFDAFIFFTYLYAPTAWGVPLVKEKALVIPTAHDEPPLRFGAMNDVFNSPRALLCNTLEEVELIERQFPNAARRRVVGVGIDPLKGNAKRFRKAFDLDAPYLLYVGRMEAGKNVLELVRRHQALVRDFHDAPSLVLMGGGDLRPRGTRVICTGRVDEQMKWDALSGALAVVVPSSLESLSLVTLEAFAAGTPVIGNVASEVVAGQLKRSGGGVTFELNSDDSFRDAVQLAGAKRAAFAKRARAFATKANWNEVIRAYLEELE